MMKIAFDVGTIENNFRGAEEDLLNCLRSLIFRKKTLPSLLLQLREDADRRQPEVGTGSIDVVAEGDQEAVVAAESLISPTVINNDDELDIWLSSLRDKIADILKKKQFVYEITVKGYVVSFTESKSLRLYETPTCKTMGL